MKWFLAPMRGALMPKAMQDSDRTAHQALVASLLLTMYRE